MSPGYSLAYFLGICCCRKAVCPWLLPLKAFEEEGRGSSVFCICGSLSLCLLLWGSPRHCSIGMLDILRNLSLFKGQRRWKQLNLANEQVNDFHPLAGMFQFSEGGLASSCASNCSSKKVFSFCVSFHPWPLWIPLALADARVSRAPAAASPCDCFPSRTQQWS